MHVISFHLIILDKHTSKTWYMLAYYRSDKWSIYHDVHTVSHNILVVNYTWSWLLNWLCDIILGLPFILSSLTIWLSSELCNCQVICDLFFYVHIMNFYFIIPTHLCLYTFTTSLNLFHTLYYHFHTCFRNFHLPV